MNDHNVGQASPARTTTRHAVIERRQARPALRALLACLTLSTTASAGVRYVEDEENPGSFTIQMEVTPADEPSPVFEHRLTYGPHERVPGNRPQWYMRSLPEKGREWKVWGELTAQESFDAYYQSGVPVDEVAWEKLDVSGRSYSQMFLDNFVVPGAQRRDCDWGIRSDQVRGADVFQILLPEFQSTRSFARMLNLHVRLAIHERRYDDAVRYLRTQYQLGADVGQEPILVCGLIGVAIAGIGNAGAADLIAAPESPNLYWALSELPAVPVPLGPAVRNELSIARSYFNDDTEGSGRTPEEWNAQWKSSASKVFGFAVQASGSAPIKLDYASQIAPLVTGLAGYSHAKQRLIDWGRTPEEIEAMPVGQVLLVYSSRVSQIGADKFWQAFIAPYSAKNFRNGDEVEAFLRDSSMLSRGEDREILPIMSLTSPAVLSVRSAEMRVARELAALRVIEALRMHAARERGRWPDSLDDVTCVPVPLNPATDKPFLYHRDGETAVLELPASEGFPGYSRRYEITIAKP